MNKFVPSDDYDTLKKQAYALYRLCVSLEQTNTAHNQSDLLAEIKQLKSQIESEREMNHILTLEIINKAPLV